MQEVKKTAVVQVVALAKGNLRNNFDSIFNWIEFLGPCTDRELFFQCANDYSDSCIDEKLQCNGRSECPSGHDENNCHRMYLCRLI
jgi:hypothetical protein